MQTILLQYKDAYFKPDDIMVFDMSDLGFPDLTTAPLNQVMDAIAFDLRSKIDALRKGDKDIESPVPFWDMSDLDVDSEPRVFKYKLSVGSSAGDEYRVLPNLDTDPFSGKKPSQTPLESTDEPTEPSKPDEPKKPVPSIGTSATDAETARLKAETALVKEQQKLASLQLEKANKALELIGKGFTKAEVSKLLGI